MHLQLLPSFQIDKEKWNDCLANSASPLIYSSASYLDQMTDNWDGIVGDDYDVIMPVPWRKKAGIKYCYDVPFIQQLGVFGKSVQQQDIEICIKLLTRAYKYGDYPLNFMNNYGIGKSSNNYMLSLASNYRSTSSFYSDNLKVNLAKAEKHSFKYVDASAEEAISIFQNLYAGKFLHVTKNVYLNFYKLCTAKAKENNLIVRKATLNEDVMAINLLLKDKFRLYNLMPSTTAEGKKISAGHFLLDNIIKEFSQTGLILDFEGSDIKGIERFYKSFGAINQPYYKIHFNRLPLLLRLFKR
ncbi:MAG: GNAT family N-acetyltransferase [Parafilimonas sp.]|nr:GNAT family N-acetyltransferase [Parafilimonas sp.]